MLHRCLLGALITTGTLFASGCGSGGAPEPDSDAGIAEAAIDAVQTLGTTLGQIQDPETARTLAQPLAEAVERAVQVQQRAESLGWTKPKPPEAATRPYLPHWTDATEKVSQNVARIKNAPALYEQVRPAVDRIQSIWIAQPEVAQSPSNSERHRAGPDRLHERLVLGRGVDPVVAH